MVLISFIIIIISGTVYVVRISATPQLPQPAGTGESHRQDLVLSESTMTCPSDLPLNCTARSAGSDGVVRSWSCRRGLTVESTDLQGLDCGWCGCCALGDGGIALCGFGYAVLHLMPGRELHPSHSLVSEHSQSCAESLPHRVASHTGMTLPRCLTKLSGVALLRTCSNLLSGVVPQRVCLNSLAMTASRASTPMRRKGTDSTQTHSVEASLARHPR